MGDIADMMLEGVLCEGCGVYLGSGNGFPGRCNSCARENKADLTATNIARNKAQHAAAKKIPCTTCGKRVSTIGMKDHIRDAHGEGA